MTSEYVNQLDERTREAIDELTDMVAKEYPGTTFKVGRGEDDPEVVHITAAVDVDDPDEVVDLVIDRMLSLEVDERIPVYLIPIRTPERVARLLASQPAPRAAVSQAPL